MRPSLLTGFIPIVIWAIASVCLASDNSEQVALVQHAAEISNLRSAAVGPFRLHARVRIFDEPPTDADYSLIWVAPERWREEVLAGGHHTIRIGGKNTVSIKDNSAETQAIHLRLRTLDVAALLYAKPSETLGGVKNLNRSGMRMQCLSRTAKHVAKTELCFDAATGVLVREEFPDSTAEFANYSDFRGKLIPRLLRTFHGKELHGEIEVQELTYDPSPDPMLFEADQQYKTGPGCEHPVVPTPMKVPDPEYPAQFRTRNPQSVKLSATVNEAGGVQDIVVIRSAGALDMYAIRALEKWEFLPATCGSAAVPFQFYTEVNFKTY